MRQKFDKRQKLVRAARRRLYAALGTLGTASLVLATTVPVSQASPSTENAAITKSRPFGSSVSHRLDRITEAAKKTTKVKERIAQWYNWQNWPNWGNWGNGWGNY